MPARLSVSRDAGYVLALCLATVVVFASACGNGFVNLDDDIYVTRNPLVQQGLTTEGVGRALTSFHAGFWIPLTWLSLQLDHALYGMRPAGYHLSNVLLHTANVALLYLVLRRLGYPREAVLLTAALFAFHPLRVESVAWVTERKDVLSTLFGLLAIETYRRWTVQPGVGRYLLVVLAFTLSLAAKPMLVTLPVLLLLLDAFTLHRTPTAADFRARVMEKIPLFAIAAGFAALTVYTQNRGGLVRSLHELPLLARLANAVTACAGYLALFLWPVDLAAYYPHLGSRLPVWQIALAAVVLIGVTVVCVRQVRTRPYLLLGWLWYLVVLAPVIGLVQAATQAMADRFTYLALVGPGLALSCLVVEWAAVPGRRTAAAVVAGVLLAAWCVLTVQQIGFWKDSPTLWEHTLAVTHDNGVAHNLYGKDLLERGRLEEALAQWRQTTRLEHIQDHIRATAHKEMALVLHHQGEGEAARPHFVEALRLSPGMNDARIGLGILLVQQGRPAEGAEHLGQVLDRGIDSPAIRYYLGLACLQTSRSDEAVHHLSVAVRGRPEWAGRIRALLDESKSPGGRHGRP